MNTIRSAYINALLADAAYVRLQRGEDGELPTGIVLVDPSLLSERLTKSLTRPQATYLLSNFEILTQTLSPTNGFDATVWRGKAGTEYSGQVYVSMRGTLGAQDILDDISLAGRGIPYEQIRDMANWWLRATAKEGEIVPQIKVDSVLPVNEAAPSIATYTFAAGTAVKATGELYGKVNSIAGVNGHSLGGYLATAFTRLFGINVDSVNTFNSAGFSDAAGSNVKTEYDSLVSLLGISAQGTGSFDAAGAKQTNYRAGNGTSVTTNNWGEMPYWALGFNQYGKKVALEQEDGLGTNPINNHSMYKLTDYLALGAALENLAPSLAFDQLNTLVKAGSNQMAASYEGVLDALRRFVGGKTVVATKVGDAGDNADSRIDFHQNLQALQTTPTFKALAGKLTLSAQSGRMRAQGRACHRTRKKKVTFSGQECRRTAISYEFRVGCMRGYLA